MDNGPPATPSYVSLLGWRAAVEPFPHVVVRDVFVPRYYRALEDAFQLVLESRWPLARFGRRDSYDAYAVDVSRALPPPIAMLLSRHWHDFLAGAVGCQATGDLSGALHHHRIGSSNGRPHTDLSSTWFVGRATPGEVNLPQPALCNYKTGEVSHPGLAARATVRAATAILYLNNVPWDVGDGGETGMYRRASDPVGSPAATVPPDNNTLLLFRTSPASFHAFISNRRAPRNSIVLWLHRDRQEVAKEFGNDQIVSWRGSSPKPDDGEETSAL